MRTKQAVHWWDKRFYVTTPIYYANAAPHIGNAYTSFIADIYARIKRVAWYTVKFATGTDENGQKMLQKAQEQWVSVDEFLDSIAVTHQHTRDTIRISYTDFIRTTEPDHHKFVQAMEQQTYDAGYIYQWAYDWLYCVWCEAFKKESDLVEEWTTKLCPDHLTPPQRIQENNWFFKLSDFSKRLLAYYNDHPHFCSPLTRFNEIKAFVERGLDDFSMSREWWTIGIPLPFDPNSVTYIWFDALYNYLTVCQDWDECFWEEWEVLHLIGKDISRFHAIYRLAMLMANNKLPRPETFKQFITWFFTIDGQKMSKSLWNSLDPVALVNEYWRDALVYYLFSDIAIGNDGDFSFERLATQKESLKKTRWNLVSRVVTLAKKYDITYCNITLLHQKICAAAAAHGLATHAHGSYTCTNPLLWVLLWYDRLDDVYNQYVRIDAADDSIGIAALLHDRYELVQFGNSYIQEKKPRESTEETMQEIRQDMEILLWLIKWIAVLSAPFLIDSFQKFQTILVVDHPERLSLQTDHNAPNCSTHFQEIIGLQEFDTWFWESKYLY